MIFPGLVATVFICLIFAWNEFFFAVNLMATKGATVPMFMISFVTSEGLFWAKLAAAGTMAMLPVVILGWLAQKQLVRGLSLGAVK
jgi:sorbitol/mannitol transport system permease protein